MSEKKYTPYIEITKHTDIDGKQVLVATIHKRDDFWTGMEYKKVKTKSTIHFNTEAGYLARVRSWGEALGIEVEENY